MISQNSHKNGRKHGYWCICKLKHCSPIHGINYVWTCLSPLESVKLLHSGKCIWERRSTESVFQNKQQTFSYMDATAIYQGLGLEQYKHVATWSGAPVCMYVLTSLKLCGHIEYWSQGTHRGNSLTSHQTYITQRMNPWPQSYLSSTASASNVLSLSQQSVNSSPQFSYSLYKLY